MAGAMVEIGGNGKFVPSSVSLKRDVNNIFTTASISAPQNILSNVQGLQDVGIEFNGRLLFHGITSPDWSLVFSGGGAAMSIPCVDRSYYLSHMVVATTKTTYSAETDIGAIVYALLVDTGIDRSRVNQTTGVTLAEDYEVLAGEMRLLVILALSKQYGFLFYLTYDKVAGVYTTYAEFDTYENLGAGAEWVETHTVTETNLLTYSLGITAVPDLVCTRVIALRDSGAGIETGVASIGAAPYLDRVVTVESDNQADISDLAASLLMNYQRGLTKMSGQFFGLAISMFNIIDISGLVRLTGTALPLTQYRVTEITCDMTESAIKTTISAVDPDAELWDPAVRQAAGGLTDEDLTEKQVDVQTDEFLAEYAEVVTYPSDPIYNPEIQYESGRTEEVALPDAFPEGTLLSVVQRPQNPPVITLASNTKTSLATVRSGLSGWTAGDTIRCRIGVEYDRVSMYGSKVSCYIIAIGLDDLTFEQFYTPDLLGTSGYLTSTPFVIPAGTTELVLQINVVNGMYMKFTSSEWTKDDGVNWTYTADGAFSSGEFAVSPDLGWTLIESTGIEYIMGVGEMVSRNVSRYA